MSQLWLLPAHAGLVQVSPHWYRSRDGDAVCRAIQQRHYSAIHYRDGRQPQKFVGPGAYLVLLLEGGAGLCIWRKSRPLAGQEGVNCVLFRNESPLLSSLLLCEAQGLAWQRWPRERLYTFVNPRKIRSPNPGCCFKKAGWRRVGMTVGGLVILAITPEPAL